MKKYSLRELYSYSTHIEELIGEVRLALSIGYSEEPLAGYIYKEVVSHNKTDWLRQIGAEIIPSIETVEKEKAYNIRSIETVFTKLENLIKEKARVTDAISTAKQNRKTDTLNLTVDSALVYNAKLRQYLIPAYENIIDNCDNEVKTIDLYTSVFNDDKEQKTIVFEGQKEKQILYDRKKFQKELKDLKILADKLSLEIEELETKRDIDFETKYSMYDTIETIIEG